MKLVDTTDEEYQGEIVDECGFIYAGDSCIIQFYRGGVIQTKNVKQITREGNRVVITTKNNTYTLED